MLDISASIQNDDDMTTASIQTAPSCDETRLAFWCCAADLHGVVLADDDVALVGTADDRTVVRTLFGTLGDAEQHELLWAAGHLGGASGND